MAAGGCPQILAAAKLDGSNSLLFICERIFLDGPSENQALPGASVASSSDILANFLGVVYNTVVLHIHIDGIINLSIFNY